MMPPALSPSGLEIYYSRDGRTADDIIERVTHRLKSHGEVLVVTDDGAERETVLSLGGMASSCQNFIRTVELALKEMDQRVKFHNLAERARFRRS